MRDFCTCIAILLLSAGGAAAQQAARLQPGQVVNATLTAAGPLTYELDLPAAHFVAGRVEQDGVDVMVTINDPDGARVLRASRLGRGPEAFAFATQAAGRYVIEVAPVDTGAIGAVRVRLTRSEAVATTPEGKVDQAAAFLSEDTPGVVVGVIRGGELVFVKGYGAADLTHGIPFTTETPTNIGSTSKHYTGFALALLASRDALSLDDDVRKHIPELPDFGKLITVRHLLSHTSGFREYIGTLMLGGRQVMEGDYIAPSEVIETVRRQTALQNEPGAEFNYNNTAFNLAAVVVERVTGRPFAEWMRAEVFLPLGMTRTWVRASPSEIIPHRSTGYLPGKGGFGEVRDLTMAAGAGGIHTTAGDVAKWMGNFKTGKLGGPEVIRQMTTSGLLNTGAPTNYGLGIYMDTNRGLRRWRHGGNDIAHSSAFFYYPDLDAGYVVFSNYQGLPGGISGVVAEAFFGNDMTPVASDPGGGGGGGGSAEALRPYAGNYELTTLGGLLVTVELAEGQLRLQLPGQSALPLRATTGTSFEVVGAPARVTFNTAAGGAVEGLTFSQNGADHTGRRVADQQPTVDLASYAGRYYSRELETYYNLTVENGRLAIRHRRFGPTLLTHTEGDSFSGERPVSLVVFRRDLVGTIIGFDAGAGRTRGIHFERVNR